MTNTPFASIADFRDIEALGHYRQAVEHEGHARGRAHRAAGPRPGQRAHADAVGRLAAAGFTTGTPWLAVNPNYKEINAAAAAADPDSVYHFYRRLIALRHEEPAVVYGDFTMLLPEDEQLYAFTRRRDNTELLVIGNFSGERAQADIPDAEAWAAADARAEQRPGAERLRPRPVAGGRAPPPGMIRSGPGYLRSHEQRCRVPPRPGTQFLVDPGPVRRRGGRRRADRRPGRVRHLRPNTRTSTSPRGRRRPGCSARSGQSCTR